LDFPVSKEREKPEHFGGVRERKQGARSYKHTSTYRTQRLSNTRKKQRSSPILHTSGFALSMTMLVHSGYRSGNHTPSFVPAYKPFSETLNKRDATTKQIKDNFSISENLAAFKSADSPPIDWIPNYSSYFNRSQRRLRQGGLTKALPAGFPTRVESPLAWTASELKKEEYTIVLSEEEILEIERGLRDFKGECTTKII